MKLLPPVDMGYDEEGRPKSVFSSFSSLSSLSWNGHSTYFCFRLSFSALNNDYFNAACNEFKERFHLGMFLSSFLFFNDLLWISWISGWLSDDGRPLIAPGPWMDVFLDPWKRENYEEYWGQK